MKNILQDKFILINEILLHDIRKYIMKIYNDLLKQQYQLHRINSSLIIPNQTTKIKLSSTRFGQDQKCLICFTKYTDLGRPKLEYICRTTDENWIKFINSQYSCLCKRNYAVLECFECIYRERSANKCEMKEFQLLTYKLIYYLLNQEDFKKDKWISTEEMNHQKIQSEYPFLYLKKLKKNLNIDFEI